jgi:hypothetical protein
MAEHKQAGSMWIGALKQEGVQVGEYSGNILSLSAFSQTQSVASHNTDAQVHDTTHARHR